MNQGGSAIKKAFYQSVTTILPQRERRSAQRARELPSTPIWANTFAAGMPGCVFSPICFCYVHLEMVEGRMFGSFTGAPPLQNKPGRLLASPVDVCVADPFLPRAFVLVHGAVKGCLFALQLRGVVPITHCLLQRNMVLIMEPL